MTVDAEPLLRIENLSVDVPGEDGSLPALTSLNLAIGRQQSVGLVGETGSGKTMTALAILGLIPRAARRRSGRIWFDGIELTALGQNELRRIRGHHIGYVPQDPLAALNPVLPIGDQITEPFRIHDETRPAWLRVITEVARAYGLSLTRRRWHRVAARMLAEVGIDAPEERAKQYPHQFSGGMRQRAIISSAIALNPALVIADEPTTALDASVERQVLGLVSRLRTEHGLSLLLISHDLNVVSHYCTHINVLFGGRKVEEGPINELFERPRHPYTAELITASPDLDRPPHSAAQTHGAEGPSAVRPHGCPYALRCGRALDVCSQTFPDETDAGTAHSFWCHNPL